MENTTPTAPVNRFDPSGYRTRERRSLAVALEASLQRSEDPKDRELRDILSEYEVELAAEAGLTPDDAYNDENLLKVLLWDRTEDRNANTVLAEVQEIPEVATPLLQMLKFATIDTLASTGPEGWSARTMRLLNAFNIVFPGIDIEGWVADIATDNAHEIEAGLGPSGAPTS